MCPIFHSKAKALSRSTLKRLIPWVLSFLDFHSTMLPLLPLCVNPLQDRSALRAWGVVRLWSRKEGLWWIKPLPPCLLQTLAQPGVLEWACKEEVLGSSGGRHLATSQWLTLEQDALATTAEAHFQWQFHRKPCGQRCGFAIEQDISAAATVQATSLAIHSAQAQRECGKMACNGAKHLHHEVPPLHSLALGKIGVFSESRWSNN